jgi:uncharacterized peroxidase-related enzyme
MSARITTVDPANSQGHVQELFGAVTSKMGKVPNALKTMAHAPGVLEGYLALSSAINKGSLSAKIREQIALAVSEANGCDYCLAAHSLAGKYAGLKPEELIDARKGKAEEPKAQATLDLVNNLLEQRGDVSDEQLADARAAGLSDAELVEVVGQVAVMTLTNFLNQLAHTEIDFPRVPVHV